MNTALLFEVLISWFPMVILIGVWFYFMKKNGSSNMSEYLKDHIEETRKMNANLERIAVAVETLRSDSKDNR